MFKKIFAVLTALMVLFAAAGCSEADKVNHNISQQAEYFQSEQTNWSSQQRSVQTATRKTMYTSTTTLCTSLKILTVRIQTRTTTNCILTPTYFRKLS